MPNSDNKIERTDLILRGSILRTHIELSGAMETLEGKSQLSELRGSALFKRSLSSFLEDLADQLGDDEAKGNLKDLLGGQIPDITLDNLAIGYRNVDPKLLQVAVTMTVEASRCNFAFVKRIGGDGLIVGLDLQSDELTLKNHPLSGLIGEIAIKDLGVYYASQSFNKVPFYSTEALEGGGLPSADLLGPTQRDFPKGWRVFAEILIGGVNLLDRGEKKDQQDLPASVESSRSSAAATEEPASSPSQDSTFWIKADKSIGPVSVRRVGLSYQAPRVGIKLDAGLQLACLTFSLEGLGLSYPIDQFSKDPKKIWEHIRFNLDGAALAFERGPLTISGGLLKVRDDPLQLDGTLLIRTSFFSISAIGSYTSLKGTPSFFVFAALQKDLGGPTFFFVTGLAFGFGVNRALKLPPIDEVQNFPLIRVATDPDYLGKKLDLGGISQKLGDYIYPSLGNYWIAAGIRFTSFELIESFVLLTVAFGTETVIAVLGLSKITIPKLPKAQTQPIPPIAYAELAIKVVLRPERGVLTAEARLTSNSYLFSKDCKLTGGFAFYAWFKDYEEDGLKVAAGDFVVTLGGYHPHFLVPPHYPVVPRVGINWKLSTFLKITGECYFALTPTCVMAGGSLSAVFQEGGLRAWFDVYADFFIGWQPLHYEARAGIRIGVSYRLELGELSTTFTIEMSATAELWGPPFEGKVHVNWIIFSFTIYLGKSREPKKPDPLDWDNFKKSCLPQTKPVKKKTRAALAATPASEMPIPISIAIVSGLIKEIKDNGQDGEPIVNPQQLRVVIKSAIPSKKITVFYGGNDIVSSFSDDKALGIGPMGIESLDSHLEVTLRSQKSPSFDVAEIRANVPKALWGQELFDPKQKQQKPELIENALSGAQLTGKPTDISGQSVDIKPDLEPVESELAWQYSYAIDYGAPSIPPKQLIDRIHKEPEDVTKRRRTLFEGLKTSGLLEWPGSLDDSIAEAGKACAQRVFLATPQECGLGMLPEISKD